MSKVYIGFGDRYVHPVQGGTGYVYFDDLRLYGSKCFFPYSDQYKIVGDLNGDCVTDFKDFALFASEWLKCTHKNIDLCVQ